MKLAFKRCKEVFTGGSPTEESCPISIVDGGQYQVPSTSWYLNVDGDGDKRNHEPSESGQEKSNVTATNASSSAVQVCTLYIFTSRRLSKSRNTIAPRFSSKPYNISRKIDERRSATKNERKKEVYRYMRGKRKIIIKIKINL